MAKIINLKYMLPSYINHGNFTGKFIKHNKEDLEYLKTKRLVFMLSIGREGSGYAANLFHTSKILSRHEARPFTNGVKVIDNAFSDLLQDESLYLKKLSTIANDLRKNKKDIYLEANHMFSKTFGQYILHYTDIPITIISLRRPLCLTIKSFIQLGWFSKRYSRASNWIYKVTEKSPLNRTTLVIETEIDEIISYFLSEKLREVKIISLLKKKNYKYETLHIPAKPQEINNISKFLNLSKKNDNVNTIVNDRSNVKINSIDSTYIRTNIHSFFKKNQKNLKEIYGITTDQKEIFILGNSWTID